MSGQDKNFFARRQKIIGCVKCILTMSAFAVVLALFLWPYAVKQKNFLDSMIKQNYFGSSSASKIDMTKVQFFSEDKKGNPFTVTAVKVQEVDPEEGVVRLERPNGEMAFRSGVKMYSSSPYALLYQKNDLLIFEREVKSVTDDGYVAEMSAVTLNYKTKTAKSSKPIRINGPKLSIDAKGFYLFGDGDNLNLLGQSCVVAKDEKKSTEIKAQKQIQLRQKERTLKAVSKASLNDGERQVFAEEIKIFFTEDEQGKYHLVKLEAKGKVHLITPDEEMWGEECVYDILTGQNRFAGNFRMIRGEIELKGDKIDLDMKEGKGILTGNAFMKKKTDTLSAETITAFFEKDAKGNYQLLRMDAEEGVHIKTPSSEIFGDRATHFMAQEKSRVEGNVRILHRDTEMKSTRADINTKEGKGVLTGNAVVKKEANTLEGEKITAYFEKDAGEKYQLIRVDADDRVHIKTISDEVFGDRATYLVSKEESTVTGNVRILHHGAEMTGEKATTNMKTGISTLQGETDSSGQKGRIRGTFFPDKLKEGKKK